MEKVIFADAGGYSSLIGHTAHGNSAAGGKGDDGRRAPGTLMCFCK